MLLTWQPAVQSTFENKAKKVAKKQTITNLVAIF